MKEEILSEAEQLIKHHEVKVFPDMRIAEVEDAISNIKSEIKQLIKSQEAMVMTTLEALQNLFWGRGTLSPQLLMGTLHGQFTADSLKLQHWQTSGPK